jgi:hypothetical protein
MNRLEIIEKLKELDVSMVLHEDGVVADVFIRDECLQAFLSIVEISEKLDNN